MEVENEGLTVWYGTEDAPAPGSAVQATSEASITVAVSPPDASNHVEVVYRINEGETQTLVAPWHRTNAARRVQYFRARFPELRVGDTFVYGVVCRCAGRQVAAAGEEGQLPSWFEVVGPPVGAGSTTAEPPITLASADETGDQLETSPRAEGAVSGEAPLPVVEPDGVEAGVPGASDFMLTESGQVGGSGASEVLGSVGRLEGMTQEVVGQLPTLTLPELMEALPVSPDPGLLSSLSDAGIRTLADIRSAGGLAHREDLAASQHRPAIRYLEAHAGLSPLALDLDVREAVIGAGFENIPAIARTDRSEFIEKAHNALGDLPAARLHAQAQVESAYLDHVVGEIGADAANGQVYATKVPPAVAALFENRFAAKCSCEDCESAVSPLAYLADLLKYIKASLRDDAKVVDYLFLERTLHQKFGTLPTSCASVSTQVRQVRICVEILRSYLKANPPNAAAQTKLQEKERSYLRTAYQVLLTRLGTSPSELRLAQSADPQTKRQLAERLGLAEPKQGADRLRDLVVDTENLPVSDLEQSLEELFGLANTRADPLGTRPSPKFLTWRRERLRELWKDQDWPEDLPGGGSSVINPDVIGPDDFRTPDPNKKEFGLWLRRRTWVDAELEQLMTHTRSVTVGAATEIVPDIETMLDSMYVGRSYVVGNVPGAVGPFASVSVSWPTTTPKEELASLQQRIFAASQDTEQVQQTARKLSDELGLTVAAFDRLMAVRSRALAWMADPRNPKVEDEEWSDIYSILTSARTRLLLSAWRSEEAAVGVEFGPNQFWISLRQPAEGIWPPWREPNVPIIDPDVLKLSDLPDSTVGDRARALFQARQTELGDFRGKLRAIREDPGRGFPDMLKTALGDPIPLDLDQILNELNSSDRGVSHAALDAVGTKLYLTSDAFRRLMTIKAKASQPDALKRPTSEEYEDLYGLLTTAHKHRVNYANWRSEEDDPTTGVTYWSALKAKLPRWRAPVETRAEWQRALHLRMRPAIVDPDRIGPLHINTPFSKSPVWVLWEHRRDEIQKKLQALKTARESATSAFAGLDTIVGSTVGISVAELRKIDEARTKGAIIALRLAQLDLTNAAFDHLVRVAGLAGQDQPVPPGDWESVYSILTEVWKRRDVVAWHDAERKQAVLLSPDHFRFPPSSPGTFPPPARSELPAWRASLEAVLDWEDKLLARIDQNEALEDSLRQVVDATEEQTLPTLRDALIDTAPSPGGTFPAKAKAIGDLLLVETRDSGCAKTTRVSQALETLQNLLFSVRTGQLRDTYPALGFTATARASFDEDWAWMGSYGPWRAAMFVFLYPENVLPPSLRRKQTPAFRKLVKDLRAGTRVTPERARAAVQQYSDYFRDVCSLELGATVPAAAAASELSEKLMFLFARSTVSDKVYWCTRDDATRSVESQTFWTEVPGLTSVLGLIGAVEYRISEARRFVYLFARVHDGRQRKLVYGRYDLENNRWVEELGELALPNDATDFETAKLIQTPQDQPPKLYIKLWDGSSFTGTLTEKGDDWQSLESTKRTKTFAKFVGVTQEVMEKWDERFRPRQAAEWMKAAHQYARDRVSIGGRPAAAGFPTFHQNSRTDWGLIALSQDAAIGARFSESLLGSNTKSMSDPDFSVGDFVARFAAADRWAKQNQYRAGYPSFDDVGSDYGVVFLLPEAIYFANEVMSLSVLNGAHLTSEPEKLVTLAPDIHPRTDHDATWQIVNRFVAVYNYTSDIPQQPYVGFPKFQEQDGFFRLCRLHREREEEAPLDPFLAPASLGTSSPDYDGPFELGPKSRPRAPANVMKETYEKNSAGGSSLLTYLDEAWYFVAVHVALQLHRSGYYTEALDWFAGVYDHSAPVGTRKVSPWLLRETSLGDDFQRAGDWVRDPLNPHLIASTRRNGYTRFSLLSLIRCFLDYADAEFTRDTSESVPLARTLYQTALELLEAQELRQVSDGCAEVIGWLKSQYGDAVWVQDVVTRLASSNNVADLRQVRSKIAAIMDGGGGTGDSIARVIQVVEASLNGESEPISLHEALEEGEQFAARASLAVMAIPGVTERVLQTGAWAVRRFDSSVARANGSPIEEPVGDSLTAARAGAGRGMPIAQPTDISLGLEDQTEEPVEDADEPLPIGEPVPLEATPGHWSPTLVFRGCIPPNPVLRALRLRAELNLHKIRSCRNIAGVRREVEDYTAPTDTSTGIPAIGAGGQLVLPGVGTLVPTPYRYPVLIERAKHLVQLAQQMENSMLSALQQRDAEAYNLLRARQDVQLARAGVRLQNLRTREAEDGVRLAELQRDRSQLQVIHYEQLLSEDTTLLEDLAMASLAVAAGAQTASAGFRWSVVTLNKFRETMAEALGATAQAASAVASVFSLLASNERRRQEWEFQKALAQQDFQIGDQQVRIAQDLVQIAGQEVVIAELQTQHAERTVDFLSSKFTNVDLYDWMAEVLEGVYRYFLEHATATAKLAGLQLAFERQEPPPPFIQADYWEPPADDRLGSPTTGTVPDRRGLTGSARLLQDIYQLDQYAFETNKRKLQLSKTISLAALSPIEFQRLRETGVMTFATPMELFERDFPQNYLCLIRRVKTSVVALVPPGVGIKATLTSGRISRVVIGGDIFQTVRVQHGPDVVALTSPRDATGVFELDGQSEMLAPFEGIGVDATWEFRMPKASNPFDYNTLADVLFTIEYTALSRVDYGQEVMQRLRRSISADLPFSFRYQFPDEWYDLHNPEQKPPQDQMVATFKTSREDFPPNLETPRIQQIALYFVRKSAMAAEIPIIHLRFREEGCLGLLGGGATTSDGVVGTRRGNAGSWTPMLGRSVIGDWELALANTQDIRARFRNDEIEDILFIITYSGRTPEWPS
jgi:Tc toxin complex TcA C-terminal TcB-binding domain